MSNSGYKTWATSRTQIERTIAEKCLIGYEGDVGIKSGFQLRKTISHYPSPIFSYCYHDDPANGNEYYVINYMSSDGGGSVIVEWRYDIATQSIFVQRKFSIRNCLKHLIWIANQKAFIGYCDDMTLRGYRGSNMEEKVRVSVSNTVLCTIYLDDYDELITAGQGHIISWRLHPIEFGRPFEWKDPPFDCDVNEKSDVWITRLSYAKRNRVLIALSEEAVYFIDMKTRKQFDMVENSHNASLTGCAWYPRFSYVITAARNGSIHVHHTVANAVIHRFPAHRDGLTGVECMMSQPILISWSCFSGCVRLWRLDTLEMMDESTLSETIGNLILVRPDRLYYSTESEIRVFEINILFTIFATLSAPAQNLRLRWIDKMIEKKSSTLLDKYNENSKEPRSRLICILDDGSIITVSPVSGSVIHMIYPTTERGTDKRPLDVAINVDGSKSFVLPQSGEIMEYDCRVNPGCKDESHNYTEVTSVVVIDTKFSNGTKLSSNSNLQACAILFGCNTGYVKLHQDASYVIHPNASEKVSLNMEPQKIHAGGVSNLYTSHEKKSISAYTGNSDTVSNLFLRDDILLSTGTDRMLMLWKIVFTKEGISDCYALTFQKLFQLQLDYQPKLITGSSHVVMLAYDEIYIKMYRINYVSETTESDSDITSVERVPIDQEIRHRARITNVAHSDILNLFLTCGMFELIKIWDEDGQLVRELDLGDTWSACFSNGRDILASYRNHIVLIEAHDYLPLELLDELLDFDDTFTIQNVPPESPIPMKGGTDIGAFAMKPGHSPFDENKFDSSNNLTLAQKQKLTKRRRTRLLRKVLLRRKTGASVSTLALADDSDMDEQDMDIDNERMKLLLEIPDRTLDPAVITDSMVERIKLCPVAPDGYIPNSVIRKRVDSIYTGYVDDLWARPDFMLTDKEVLEDEGENSECASDEPLVLSFNPSTESSKEFQNIILQQEEDDGNLATVKSTVTEKPKNIAKFQRTRRLEDVVNSVNKEKWCPIELHASNIEDSLVDLSNLLESVTDQVVVIKILASLLKILEEHKNLTAGTGKGLVIGFFLFLLEIYQY
uniref:uncharacterized protein LOC120343431 n=1 Tax=Styela clava TaxID=7725 RepID=UPI00193A591F|nr:uncharacterized protein LOC120343431 [Styela clava]